MRIESHDYDYLTDEELRQAVSLPQKPRRPRNDRKIAFPPISPVDAMRMEASTAIGSCSDVTSKAWDAIERIGQIRFVIYGLAISNVATWGIIAWLIWS